MVEEKDIGIMLERADCNLARIALACLFRAIICVPMIVLNVVENGMSATTAIMSAVFLIIMLWPLHHIKDYAEFNEHGICYKGKKWEQQELGEVSWRSLRSNAQILEGIYMDTNARNFDFTYIKDGKKKFNKAYFGTVKRM